MDGIKSILSLHPSNFKKYLKNTKNTICGRNPILILMQIIECCGNEIFGELAKYSQSGRSIKNFEPNDSSVSYASILFYKKT
jgi:AmmeMemoRadiSam system protein B